MLDKVRFLEKYHIKEDQFNSINLSWEDLKDIYMDYVDNVKNEAEDVIDNVVKKLRKSNDIHSIRARVKDSEHLIEKIIRKKIKNPERVIDIENYKNEITDIIGIRMICLFKTNIKKIDTYIKKLPYDIKGKIEVNLREGDDDKFYIGIGDCKFHPAGYRSVHYNIEACDSSGEKYICEVQLRTIFEEAWGEIDHTIRYPYLQENPYLNDYFKALNRLSGLADEMANFSEDLVELIEKGKKSEEAEKLSGELAKLKKELEEKDEKILKYEKELKKTKGKNILRSKSDVIAIAPSTRSQRVNDTIIKPLAVSSEADITKDLKTTSNTYKVNSKISPAGKLFFAAAVGAIGAAMIDSAIGSEKSSSSKKTICKRCNSENLKTNSICSNCGNSL